MKLSLIIHSFSSFGRKRHLSLPNLFLCQHTLLTLEQAIELEFRAIYPFILTYFSDFQPLDLPTLQPTLPFFIPFTYISLVLTILDIFSTKKTLPITLHFPLSSSSTFSLFLPFPPSRPVEQSRLPHSSPLLTTFLTSFPLHSFFKVVQPNFHYTTNHLATGDPHYLTQGLKIYKD